MNTRKITFPPTKTQQKHEDKNIIQSDAFSFVYGKRNSEKIRISSLLHTNPLSYILPSLTWFIPCQTYLSFKAPIPTILCFKALLLQETSLLQLSPRTEHFLQLQNQPVWVSNFQNPCPPGHTSLANPTSWPLSLLSPDETYFLHFIPKKEMTFSFRPLNYFTSQLETSFPRLIPYSAIILSDCKYSHKIMMTILYLHPALVWTI